MYYTKCTVTPMHYPRKKRWSQLMSTWINHKSPCIFNSPITIIRFVWWGLVLFDYPIRKCQRNYSDNQISESDHPPQINTYNCPSIGTSSQFSQFCQSSQHTPSFLQPSLCHSLARSFIVSLSVAELYSITITGLVTQPRSKVQSHHSCFPADSSGEGTYYLLSPTFLHKWSAYMYYL